MASPESLVSSSSSISSANNHNTPSVPHTEGQQTHAISSNNNNNNNTTGKKRHYSKHGCQECKRRKIKCNEAKPYCWHCKRLGKQCVYKSKNEYPYDVINVKAPNTPITPNNNLNPIPHTPNNTIPIPIPPPNHNHNIQPPPHPNINAIPQFNYPNNNNNNYMPYPYPPQLNNYYNLAQQQIQFQTPPPHLSPNNPIMFPHLNNSNTVGNNNNNNNNNININNPLPPNSIPPMPQNPITNTSPIHNHIQNPLSTPMYTSSSPNSDSSDNKSNLLANNLNDLLTSRIEESNKSVEDKELIEYINMFNNLFQPSSINLLNQNNSLNQQNDNLIIGLNGEILNKDDIPYYFFENEENLLNYFKLNENHKLYLKYFSNDYSRVILPFTPNPSYNPARQILLHYAKNSNYLLAAILACGALQAYRETKDPKDELAYCSYLSSSLKLLSSKIHKNNSSTSTSANEDETMLLCVLLLTSYSATSLTHKWRPHLKGAKDLIDSYYIKKDQLNNKGNRSSITSTSTTTTTNSNTNTPGNDGFVIAFCRCWFASIEVLANFSSPSGGSLETDEDFDLFMSRDYDNFINKLYLLQLVTNDNFNLILGYTNSCSLAIQNLLKLIKRKKILTKKLKLAKSIEEKRDLKKLELKLFDFIEIHNLFTAFVKETNYSFIDKSGLVPLDHPIHPNNQAKNMPIPKEYKHISPEAIDYFISSDTHEKVYFSWCDISHHGMVYAAYLVLCSWINETPRENLLVQQLVRKILSLMPFIDSEGMKFTNSCAMVVQWPVYIAGLHATEQEHRDKVIRFFNILGTDLSTGSAKISIEKLQKVWKEYDLKDQQLHEQGIQPYQSLYPVSDDEETDGVDLISY